MQFKSPATFTVFAQQQAPFSRELLRSVLHQRRIRSIVEFGDLRHAEAHLENHRPDMIFMEWQRREKGAAEFVARAHSLFNTSLPAKLRVPVIAITDWGERNFIQRLARYGVDGVLLRPFNLVSINRYIDRAMEAYGQRVEASRYSVSRKSNHILVDMQELMGRQAAGSRF